MANFTSFYIPSRESGKTWRVYFHKPTRRPAYVHAQEGESRDGIFTPLLYGSRHITVGIPGRATLQAVTTAGLELLRQMATNNYIYVDAVDEYTPRLVQ
jgi:hypothetical protein